MNKVNIDNFRFEQFKPLWNKLKFHMDHRHFELFYELVDIDGKCGRRIYPGCAREDNPRFYRHWFGMGRCHWNVVLPCFMLNHDNFVGQYSILTNDKHSAILDTKNKILYCPTLDEEEICREMLSKDCMKMSLLEHLPSIDCDIEKFDNFVERYISYAKLQKW